MTVELHESVAANPVKQGNRWLVCLAKPGQGSSGKYSADVLREYGPTAFPPKSKSYFGHNAPQDRDPRDQLGTYAEGAFWNEEAQELQALLTPYPRWKPLLEEMASDLEMSIYSKGTKDENGNVLTLEYSRTNSVDAVGYAGLEGSSVREQMESLVESARAEFDVTPSVAPAQENGNEKLMEEKLDKLISLLETFVSESKAAAAEKVQATVNAEALSESAKEAVESYDAKVALIEAAREDLTASQVASLREAAKQGADVAPLVESAKKVTEEIRSTLTEAAAAHGRVITSANDGFRPTAWGK